MKEKPIDTEPPITPVDVLTGLGGADRNLLATSLALFEDSKLWRHAEKLVSRGADAAQRAWTNTSQSVVAEATEEINKTKEQWRLSEWSDDDLRLLLWIRLREALGLPPRLSASCRGCAHLADDVAASLITSLDPAGMAKSGHRWLYKQGWLAQGEQATTLSHIVVPVLDELLEQSLEGEGEVPDRDARRQHWAEALSALRQLTQAEQDTLLHETGATQLNNRALLRSLALGGSLGAFGLTVSSAGFSAYILAAQASAFIPVVTGPGLVSLVAVVSNPVFIAAAAGGGAWSFARSARREVNANVAARVVAMLAIQGLQTGRGGLESLRRSFDRVPDLVSSMQLARSARDGWQAEWESLQVLLRDRAEEPPAWLLSGMETAIDPDVPETGLSPGQHTPTGSETKNAAALSALTVGDVVYSYYAIDPTAVQAVDFSHVADIDGRIDFSVLANDMLEGSDQAVLGGISRLKGYVAEKAVAAELTAAGHVIRFPEASNEPGIDLLVDGQPFQVKFHATPQGIREHFDTYDYPVFANSELDGEIPEEWADQVYFIDGLSNELVTDITESSVHAGGNLFDTAVLTSVGVISVARGVFAYRGGQVTGQQAFEQVLLDGSVRMGLAGGGSVVGSAVGFVAFGPAGAWVFGAGAPVLAAMQTGRVSASVRQRVKGETHRQWEEATHGRLDALQQTVLRALHWKIDTLEAKVAATPGNEAGIYLKWRFADDIRFARECRQRVAAITRSHWEMPEQRATELFRWVAVCAVHPAAYQPEMRAIAALLGERPGLSELVDSESLTGALNETKEQAARGFESAREKARESGISDWVTRNADQLWRRRGGNRNE